jgi:hypothetical protein
MLLAMWENEAITEKGTHTLLLFENAGSFHELIARVRSVFEEWVLQRAIRLQSSPSEDMK